MSCDEKFSRHLKVVINSSKFYTSHPIHLFLIIKNKKSLYFFSKFLSQFVDNIFSFEILLPDLTKFDSVFRWRVANHALECYLRLLIGSCLPENLDRVLYLDTDLIIQGDLWWVFSTTFQTTIAGVKDFYGIDYAIKNLAPIDAHMTKYINAGVILINLHKWRTHIDEAVILHFLNDNFNYLKMLDQDLINLFLQKEITYIDNQWNHTLLYGYQNNKISKEISIFHMLWPRKWDSNLYPNYQIRRLYRFFSWEPESKIVYLCDFIIYYFLSYPLQKFMFFKAKCLYKFSKVKIIEYFNLLFIFHPLVFSQFCREIFLRYKKFWLLWIIRRIREFFEP